MPVYIYAFSIRYILHRASRFGGVTSIIACFGVASEWTSYDWVVWASGERTKQACQYTAASRSEQINKLGELLWTYELSLFGRRVWMDVFGLFRWRLIWQRNTSIHHTETQVLNIQSQALHHKSL